MELRELNQLVLLIVSRLLAKLSEDRMFQKTNSADKATARQRLQDVLSYLGGSDTIDDWVEAAREQQVHGAEENPDGCRKTVSDPIRQESHENDGQADGDDHDVGDAGVKRFDP